jgi:putative lipoprotein
MTVFRHSFGWLFACVIGTTACAVRAGYEAVVSGTAYCAECIGMPPDAVFDAILEDISRADTAATEMGRAHLEPAGEAPFRFEISYDRAAIDARHSYAVRARITRGGELLFVSDTVYPVLTRGAGDEVNIQLRRK